MVPMIMEPMMLRFICSVQYAGQSSRRLLNRWPIQTLILCVPTVIELMQVSSFRCNARVRQEILNGMTTAKEMPIMAAGKNMKTKASQMSKEALLIPSPASQIFKARS